MKTSYDDIAKELEIRKNMTEQEYLELYNIWE